MDLKQCQTVSQKLVMTNEMKQSLAVLQMPVTELVETIKKELDENPVLEEEFPDKEPNPAETLISMNTDVGYDRNEIFFEEEKESPINYAVKKKTLKDFLYEQAGYLKESEETKAVMSYMIENIDRRGYLGCGVEEITEELSISQQEVLRCLKILQEFQPDGVFARDLKECLTIQLRKKNINCQPVVQIVENCLELLSENKIKAIAQKNHISLSQAAEYCKLIKKLEPKPSRGFAEEEDNGYIIPEAYIQRTGNTISIMMNDEALPRLMISRYYKELYHTGMQEETKLYMKERLNAALSLMKSIEQRKSTVCNILQAVVAMQEEYFRKGPLHLKPMTINTIAWELGCHESTVSRAIRDKYIQTPYGLMKIKSLFTSGYISAGQELSAKVIKREIQDLISRENKNAPFSDQQIAILLENGRIRISRRTVAKYREEAGIPSSSKRKIY